MQSTTTPRAHRAPRPLLPRPSKQPTAVSHPESPSLHSPNSLSSASRPPIDVWYTDQFNTISVGQNPYLVSSPQKRETLGSWRDNSNAHNIRAPPPSPQKSEAGHDNTRPYTPLDGGYWCSAGHMQPTCLDRLAKRPGEEERKVGEIQRMVEGERLKENVGQKNRKKKKKKNNNDDQTFSGVDIAADEGSLEGVEVLSKPSPVPAGKVDWARAWQIQGEAALARCPRLGSACVEEGESAGFDSVLLGGLTPEQIKQPMCETQSWYIESVDRDGGSNAMGWNGSIPTPTVPVVHPEDKARGGEGKQSLEGIMIADMLQKANIAEYRLKRARERIQKLEQALVVMGKEVAKCREEEQRLAQRVGEIECRNRLIGEILDGHAQTGFERGDWGRCGNAFGGGV